ncbi:hypothetical protein D927_01806 [Enterococcus faecalis 02-MB-BW-10]|nr:hypothetical protein HMPREF9510_02520 [Enterococcus faecalis TX0470]EPH79394.1 hypothetical protein D927_01806 [Enterococcus faecalis 02-MB-BW-10]
MSTIGGKARMLEDTTMIQKWDKVFQKSDKVNHRKVTFTNRF